MGQFLRHTSPSLSTFQPYRLAAQGFLELDHGTDLGSLLPWGGGGDLGPTDLTLPNFQPNAET